MFDFSKCCATYCLMKDTIYALSSAAGTAGVSIIRISGDLSLSIAKALTGRKEFKPRYAYFDKYSYKGQEIDSGLTLYFKGPNSFTGQDTVEFQVHGSKAVINKMFEVIESQGARLAKCGEFTRLSYENGKLDLLQAQGLLDLINSQTDAQRKLALHFQNGDVSQKYMDLRNLIIQAQSLIESSIDFSEDELPIDLENRIKSRIIDAKSQISAILSNDIGSKITQGFIVSVIGEPNSGKSSLFNFLLGSNKAIVSDIPGTTRDILESVLDINGYKVILSDTAGIRDAKDEIEKEGIKRALDLSNRADLKIYMVTDKFDENLIDDKTIIVYNKSDSIKHEINKDFKNPQFIVSIKNNTGMDKLKEFIKDYITENLSSSNIYSTTNHHKRLLKQAYDYLQIADKENQVDLKAENLKLASVSLSEIIGIVSLNDLLDNIFSSFCIGK